jgi:hypothetical protein
MISLALLASDRFLWKDTYQRQREEQARINQKHMLMSNERGPLGNLVITKESGE